MARGLGGYGVGVGTANNGKMQRLTYVILRMSRKLHTGLHKIFILSS